jgi:hypothetical protein
MNDSPDGTKLKDASCRWWRPHAWSRWGAPKQIEFTTHSSGVKIAEGVCTVQQRVCQRCGLIQTKDL